MRHVRWHVSDRANAPVRARWRAPRTGLMRDAEQPAQGTGSARAGEARAGVAPSRVVIEVVTSGIDGGRFPAQRVAGDTVTVALDPAVVPAHVFRLRRRVRTERDLDHFF